MANINGVLYIGMTNDLRRRVQEHQEGSVDGFTKRYACTRLVYFEYTQYVYNAIARENVLKGWNRNKKEELIRSMNPKWKDLSQEIFL